LQRVQGHRAGSQEIGRLGQFGVGVGVTSFLVMADDLLHTPAPLAQKERKHGKREVN